MKKIQLIFVLAFLFIGINTIFAQKQKNESPYRNEAEYEKQYNRNIRKSRINGVYIPKDINDAIVQLKKLSSSSSLAKFKNAPENKVAKKLHFGIGNWMIVNWNFYEGSRFSDYLKKMGVGHPDDMADFMIVTFHRYLNNKELNSKKLATKFKTNRKLELEKSRKVLKTIKVK